MMQCNGIRSANGSTISPDIDSKQMVQEVGFEPTNS